MIKKLFCLTALQEAKLFVSVTLVNVLHELLRVAIIPAARIRFDMCLPSFRQNDLEQIPSSMPNL